MQEISKQYDASKVEDKIYKKWEASGAFSPQPNSKQKPFTIVMPPPNVTGRLHLGHASMLALEDLMIRHHRMLGEAALWIPGFDHASIATQNVVEKQLLKEGLTRHDLGRAKFLARVKTFAEDSKKTIRGQIIKMGASCDWTRERYTLDEGISRAVRTIFVRMYNDGLIYRGNRIVNWCPRCTSTLADDEVEYKETKSKFYYFKYGPVTIGTARPETKFADKVIIVHPDDARYKKLIGQKFMVPWIDGEVEATVIADPAAEMTMGSGAMTITPAHSFVDFDLAKKHGLEIIPIIDEQGNFTAAAGKFEGKNALASRDKIVEILRAKGLVESIDEDYTHNLSVCYRCGTAIEPLVSLQWFINVNHPFGAKQQTLKEMSTKAVSSGQIKIIPPRFEKTYFQWMDNLHDWTISRQIWFGHQIPVWYCQACQKQGKPGRVVSVDPPKSCPDCNGTKLKQDPDTLDTWFSSGLWTFSTLGWPDDTDDLNYFHPTSVLETGYDILTFWVARMILMTGYALETVPFHHVYLHGLVRDDEGRKMSKSLGNIIDPLDMIAKFGTDAVRLSLISGTAPGGDSRINEDKIAGYRNFINKLWNISRYILTSTKVSTNKPKAKTLADKWLLSRLNQVIKEVSTDLDKFNFSQAGETLRAFTWDELADWYLEIAKVEPGKDAILRHTLDTILRLWHPFTPFVTESIYENISDDMLITAAWPKANSKQIDQSVEDSFSLIKEIIVGIRNARSAHKIEPAKKIPAVIYAGKNVALVEEQSAIIRALARLDNLSVTKAGDKPDDAIALTIGELEIYLPGAIDKTKEQARIGKLLAETVKYKESITKKLANKSFVAKAPKELVAAEKKKLKEQADKISKLKQQKKDLQ